MNDCDIVSVKLIRLVVDEATGKTEMRYAVTHNNGVTTVKQYMHVSSSAAGDKWSAAICFDEDPSRELPSTAAATLGDWLVRLGTAIKQAKINFPVGE